MSFVIEVQWHSPGNAFAAGFIRDSEPWILDGALVGMGPSPGDAVTDLLGIARHLVIKGGNFLTGGPIPLADRKWLFSLLSEGESGDEMYLALRAAEVIA
jgi:hypothetical protein